MRKLVCFYLFLSLFFLAGLSGEEKIQVTKTYSQKQIKTGIAQYPDPKKYRSVFEQPIIHAEISFLGETRPKQNPNVILKIDYQDKTLKFKDNHKVLCFADNKLIQLPEERYSILPAFVEGLVSERISLEVPYDTFAKLCEASKLEFYVGDIKFEASEEEREGLQKARNLYERYLPFIIK